MTNLFSIFFLFKVFPDTLAVRVVIVNLEIFTNLSYCHKPLAFYPDGYPREGAQGRRRSARVAYPVEKICI